MVTQSQAVSLLLSRVLPCRKAGILNGVVPVLTGLSWLHVAKVAAAVTLFALSIFLSRGGSLKCLVVHNNAKSNKLTDQVFWYKAEAHDNVKLGSQQFWDYSDSNTSEGQMGGGEEYQSSKYVINKKY